MTIETPIRGRDLRPGDHDPRFRLMRILYVEPPVNGYVRVVLNGAYDDSGHDWYLARY